MEFHRDHSRPRFLLLGSTPWLNPIWKHFELPMNELEMGGKITPLNHKRMIFLQLFEKGTKGPFLTRQRQPHIRGFTDCHRAVFQHPIKNYFTTLPFVIDNLI